MFGNGRARSGVIVLPCGKSCLVVNLCMYFLSSSRALCPSLQTTQHSHMTSISFISGASCINSLIISFPGPFLYTPYWLKIDPVLGRSCHLLFAFERCIVANQSTDICLTTFGVYNASYNNNLLLSRNRLTTKMSCSSYRCCQLLAIS